MTGAPDSTLRSPTPRSPGLRGPGLAGPALRAPTGRGPEVADPELVDDVRFDERLVLGKPWMLLVWDDPVNLMNYVTWVFTSYFGFPKPKAERLMLQVHTEGKAAVHSGTREEIERHVEAMHGYGLQATMEQVDG